jgi:hypothetical protein
VNITNTKKLKEPQKPAKDPKKNFKIITKKTTKILHQPAKTLKKLLNTP